MKRITKIRFQIDCSIFAEHEERMNKLNSIILRNQVSSNKVNHAKELQDIAEFLSQCPNFNEENDDCEHCQFILNLRKESCRIIADANVVSF